MGSGVPNSPSAVRPEYAAVIVIAACLFGPSCAERTPTVTKIRNAIPPSVVVIDTLVLEDDVEPKIRHLLNFAVSPGTGLYHLTDYQAASVFTYDRRGVRIGRTAGRSFGGNAIAGILGAIPLDTAIAVVDNGSRQVKYFTVNDSIPYRAVTYGGSASHSLPSHNAEPSGLLLAVFDTADGTVVRIWDDIRPEPLKSVALPSEYARHPHIWLFNALPLAAWGDSALVGFGALDRVALTAVGGGAVARTVDLPAARRRGVDTTFLFDERNSIESLTNSLSVLVATHRTPTGDFLVVHSDYTVDWDEKSRVLAQLYVSAITADLRMGCLDAALPLTADSQQYPAFRGDTLFVATRQVTAAGSRTVVVRFRFGLHDCTWVDFEAIRP